MDTTGQACVDFWKWAPQKGLVNGNTAIALRVACSQVLGLLENWETLDVAALDIEDVFSRFVNLKGKNFTPESLATYKSRFVRALSMFSVVREPRRVETQDPDDDAAREACRRHTEWWWRCTANDGATQPLPQHVTSRSGLVDYPFPLREGRFAYLKLPANLTAAT